MYLKLHNMFLLAKDNILHCVRRHKTIGSWAKLQELSAMESKVLRWLKNNLRTRRDWGVALTALTPLAMVGRAVADYTVSLTAILFLFDCVVCHRWNWIKKPWVVAALLLWAYSVLRAAFIEGDGGAGLFAAFVWLRYIVFAASMAEWTLSEERGRTWLFRSSIAAVLFLSVDGFIQHVFGYDVIGNERLDVRLTGIYKRPILGITIANLFAPGIFWLLKRKQIVNSVLLTFVCFAAVFLSGDRMGLVLASAVMLVWGFFFVRNSQNRWKAFALIACFFLGLVAFSPKLTERQIQSTAMSAKHISSSAYGLVWESAWQVGKEHPFFGVGMRQFRVACPDERLGPIIDSATGYSRCYQHPHNAYMEWFAEGGFVGLLGFAGFALTVGFCLLRRLLSRESDLVLWGLSIMLAVRLMPLFISTGFFNNWSAIPLWLAIGWAMSYKPKAFERKSVS